MASQSFSVAASSVLYNSGWGPVSGGPWRIQYYYTTYPDEVLFQFNLPATTSDYDNLKISVVFDKTSSSSSSDPVVVGYFNFGSEAEAAVGSIEVGNTGVTGTFNITGFHSTRSNCYIKFKITASGSVNVYTPTITGTYYEDDPPPEPGNLTPYITAPSSGQSILYGSTINFAWEARGDGTQTKAEIEVDYDTQTPSTYTVNGSATTYSSSAYRSVGQHNWRIRLTSSYGKVSDWVYSRFTISTGSVNINLLYPTGNERVYGDTEITLSWEYTGDGTVGDTQLQISIDNGQNWVDRPVSQPTFPALYFSAGTVKWRVRVAPAGGSYGGWKQASFVVAYEAYSYIEQKNSPTSGNINASVAQTFTATLKTQGTPHDPFTLQSAVFRWKAQEDAIYHDISMTVSGLDASTTIPANTFPVGAIVWYIEGTDNTDSTTQTPEYTVSTLPSDIDAQPVAPSGTIEISNDDITFTWRFASTSGEPQNGAELQYSYDQITWLALAQVTGTTSTFVAEPNTFSAATVFWRVRAFNRQGTAGPWSSVAQFVAFGAPDAPSVTVDEVPFAVIHWQVVGQSAFEVEVDGTTYGPFIGADKEYALYDYLEDGVHTARVRVRGEYGLWGLWGETQFTIENESTSFLVLRCRSYVDADLAWNGGIGNYYVYRDHKLIARTNGLTFSDRTAIGTHDYYVVEKMQSGNYNKSNIVTKTMDVDCMHMAALAGGDWVAIRHTLKSQSDPSYSQSATVVYDHLDGSEYVSVSVGPFLEESASYSAVFLYTEKEEHLRFRELFRKPVIMKTTDGEVLIGFLDAYERKPKTSRNRQYYTAYTFRLQRIDWEDFIDDTQ